MDLSLDGALHHNTKDIERIVLFYDVVCKYSVSLLDRFRASPELNMPKFKELNFGVGVWHIYAHINRCFPRFSPNFIKGVGVVDGEILETLWSNLNLISGSCRTMSLANRAETLNSHMNDSNWKKMTDMRT